MIVEIKCKQWLEDDAEEENDDDYDDNDDDDDDDGEEQQECRVQIYDYHMKIHSLHASVQHIKLAQW